MLVLAAAKATAEGAYNRITGKVVLGGVGVNGFLGQVVEIVGLIGREV